MEELVLILGSTEEEIEIVLAEGEGAYIPPYEGEYEVTPRLTEQVLETNGKRMTDDMTVHTIPVVTTTNPYGGNTVVIG